MYDRNEVISRRREAGAKQHLPSEEDQRATTDVQNALGLSILFSFILFASLWTKTPSF